MKNRRSLTPSTAGVHGAVDAEPKVHATRRDSARHEIHARVVLTAAGRVPLEGWALNVSRGGVRVILEEKVDLGAEFEIAMMDGAGGDPTSARRIGRIVWVQDEPDGVIAGIEFRAVAQVSTSPTAKA